MSTPNWILLGIVTAIAVSYIAEMSNTCSAFVDTPCVKESNYYR